jgi:hypothetical protein
MTTAPGDIRCGDCGRVLEATGLEAAADRLPCPACGSRSRSIDRRLEDKVELHTTLRLRAIRGATGKVAQEQQAGDDLRRSDGTWVEKGVVKDFEADRYLEHVETADGEVLHHDEGRLSEHTGHGSDKPALRLARDRTKAEKHRQRALRKAEIDAAWRARTAGR